jgi:hypothetical protein
LETVTVSEGATALADKAFRFCRNLKTVSLPNTLQTIGAYAFEECDILETVNIPGNVTSIGAYAFADSGIINVVFDDPEHSKLEAIEKETFLRCKRIKAVTLPGSVRTIGNEAFLGCSLLHTVRIGEGCRSIGIEAFCSTECGPRHIYLPGTIQSIGSGAFFSYRPTTFHSPKNSVIQDYCSSNLDCYWEYQPSKAELEQALIAKQKAERKESIDYHRTHLASEKKREVDINSSIAYKKETLEKLNNQIAELEARLPKLTGIFSKGKREKCEEDLKKCQHNRASMTYSLRESEQELEECKRSQEYHTKKLRELNVMI